MRRFFVFLTLILTLTILPTISQAFEGIIVQKTTQIKSEHNPGLDGMKKMLKQMPAAQRKMMEDQLKAAMVNEPSEPEVSMNTTYIKGSMMRMDFEKGHNEKAFMVMDMRNRIIRNFFPERKAYMEMSLDEVQQMRRGFSNMNKEMGMNTDTQVAGELEKTGEKKKINGYMCEQYTQKVGDYTNEYWLTKDITMRQIMGDFKDYIKTVGDMGDQDAEAIALMKLNSYPILTITEDKYGTNRREVTKIEEKKLARDLFDVPNGFKKQSMKDMMSR